MSTHLTADERGILQPCAACGTTNRVAWAKLAEHGRCGSCQAALTRIAEPVEISGPAPFLGLIQQSPLPVVIDFWAPWCGPCRSMAPEFARAAAQAGGEAIFIKVNTDEEAEITARFRLQGIPAFALMKGGQLIAQTSGAQPADRLLAWMCSA